VGHEVLDGSSEALPVGLAPAGRTDLDEIEHVVERAHSCERLSAGADHTESYRRPARQQMLDRDRHRGCGPQGRDECGVHDAQRTTGRHVEDVDAVAHGVVRGEVELLVPEDPQVRHLSRHQAHPAAFERQTRPL